MRKCADHALMNRCELAATTRRQVSNQIKHKLGELTLRQCVKTDSKADKRIQTLR